jgi:peroxiredoxin
VLDKLIERYHISDLDKMQRKEIVIKIMNQAFVHMVTKPNSDRRDAVKVLAQISYNIAKKLTDEIDEDNMAQALASRPQGQLVGQRLSQLVVEEDMVVECSVDGED